MKTKKPKRIKRNLVGAYVDDETFARVKRLERDRERGVLVREALRRYLPELEKERGISSSPEGKQVLSSLNPKPDSKAP